MPETDPADRITEALARLRWRGRPMPGLSHGHPGHAHGRERGRRGGGPALVRLLSMLASAEDPLGVGEIAERIGVDQPRASRLVAQAVELGLVRREADASDARKIRIVLTDEGAAMAGRVRGERAGAMREALAGFSPAEQEQLANLLGRLAEAWPAHGRGPGPGIR